MGMPVVLTGICKCAFGAAPTPLMLLPLNLVFAKMLPIGSIMDNIPFLNILPFGMCMNLGNPMVAAATAAAWGILTPMPCIPIIPAPWTTPKPTLQIKGKPALTESSCAQCIWGGSIQILFPGVTLCTC